MMIIMIVIIIMIIIIIIIILMCRVFRATSQGAFIDSLKDVVADIKYYLLFMLFTIWGFASAFHILYKRQQKEFKVRLSLFTSYLVKTAWLRQRT
jgi:hypothetical protein